MKIEKITNLLATLAIITVLSLGVTSCGSETTNTTEGDAVEASTDKKCDGDSKKCGEGKCDDAKAKKCDKTKKCGDKKDHFASMDTDKDGFITKEEFMTSADVKFAAKDGKISKENCMMFDKFNTDGDELLSKEEYVAGHDSMFTMMDADTDGKVSKEEMGAVMKPMMDAKCGAKPAKCGDAKPEGKCGDAKAKCGDAKAEGKCGDK